MLIPRASMRPAKVSWRSKGRRHGAKESAVAMSYSLKAARLDKRTAKRKEHGHSPQMETRRKGT